MSFYESPLENDKQFKLITNAYLDLISQRFNDQKKINKIYTMFCDFLEHCFYESEESRFWIRLKSENKIIRFQLKKIQGNFIWKKFGFLLQPLIKFFFKILFFLLINLKSPLCIENKFKIKYDNFRVFLIKYLISNQEFHNEKKLKNLFLSKLLKKLELKSSILDNLQLMPETFFCFKEDIENLMLYLPFEIFCNYEMISILLRTKSLILEDLKIGASIGWFNDSFLYKKRIIFSQQGNFNSDIDFKKLDRYFIKPKNKKNKTRYFWITRMRLDAYNRSLEPSIDYEDNKLLQKHIRKVHQIYKEKNYKLVLNPKGYNSEYQKYILPHNTISGFDPRKINKNDFLIFDSINQSLIFYALKFDLKFLIYSTRIPLSATQKLKDFIKLLEEKGMIEFI